MSPILILLGLYAYSKRKPPGAPVAPGGSAVTTMAVGKRYTATLLFRGLGPGMPTPSPDVLAASATAAAPSMLSIAAEPALTHVVQNADATWAAQVTGSYQGGPSLPNQAWSLLQLAAA